jgi:hypothetical protein
MFVSPLQPSLSTRMQVRHFVSVPRLLPVTVLRIALHAWVYLLISACTPV